MLRRLSLLSTGSRSKWAVIVAWVLVACAMVPLQGTLQERAEDESGAFQGRSAESTKVDDLLSAQFPDGEGTTALIVYHRDGGLTGEDAGRIDGEALSLCRSGAIPGLERVVTPSGLPCGSLDASVAPESTVAGPVSEDGSLATVSVKLPDDATDAVVRDVATLRALVPDPEGDGLRAFVTGEAGFTADQAAAVEGIDGTLLAITMTLVLVLLLLTYRSPVVAFIPLLVVGIAYLVAGGAVLGLSEAGAFRVTGQATAILIVLMFGAGTDYCLLVVSRVREELRASDDTRAALARATERSAPAVLSAGSTVVAAMLVLGLAAFNATRWMGPVLAVGVLLTMLACLTLLPALLAAFGRAAFWPAIPRASSAPAGPTVWSRVGARVLARPRLIVLVLVALLAAGSLGNLGGRGLLDFSESFRTAPESVLGQDLVREGFSAGVAAPMDVVVAADASGAVVAALSDAPEVLNASAVWRSRDNTLTQLEVVLTEDPFSEAAVDAIPRIREIAQDAAGGQTVLVGGATAAAYDTRATLSADAKLIVPLTLVLILLIVAALVRAIVVPLYLVATVVLSFGFALGASSLVFTHLLGWPDSDPTLPLFAFIFLVALGVDYNIFLIGRVREEQRRLGTRQAVVAGLERTGGVITSAGLILAGTFCALMALDVVSLVQVGFTVALGLLVDTFLVRVWLVPAIAVWLGERNWWPSNRSRAPRGSTVACNAEPAA